MEKTAIVRSLTVSNSKKNNAVVVEPLASAECAGCAQSCSKRKSYIVAVNSRNLNLKVNSLVKINSSKKKQGVEALISLFFPIAMSVMGFFLASPIFNLFTKITNGSKNVTDCPEGIKALIVIIFLAVAIVAVLAFSRCNCATNYPQITDVIEQEN